MGKHPGYFDFCVVDCSESASTEAGSSDAIVAKYRERAGDSDVARWAGCIGAESEERDVQREQKFTGRKERLENRRAPLSRLRPIKRGIF